MPTFKRLRYFIILEETRHFGRAADRAHVTQPTLSQQLKALEDRLGVQLIERKLVPIKLTPVGEEVARRARRILLELDDLKNFVSRANDRIAGTLVVGIPPTLGPYLLPHVVKHWHADNPDLRLRIVEGVVSDLLPMLKSGDIDMMIASLPLSGRTLTIEPLFREPLSLVCAPDSPMAIEKNVRSGDLAGKQILSLDPRHRLYDAVADFCQRLGADLIRDYHGSSLDALAQMVASGNGLAILPALYLKSEVGGRRIVTEINLEEPGPFRSIAAAWRTESAYAQLYREVAETVRSVATRLIGEFPENT